ncbi:MAG: biotin/lipoyl-containing protein [Betaproteobacteria bacterium]
MRYEVDVNGRARQVAVERAGDAFTIAIDGREWRVDAARVDGHTLSLLVGDRSFEVTLAPDAASGQLAVGVGATPLLVGVNSRRRWGRKDEGAHAGSGPQRVTAPMPGKIVRVLVAPGDAVRARQGLVVVEAMKMENELRAGRDGTVAEIHAQEGQSVDAGALLVVIQ